MIKTKAEERYADIIDLPHHELTTRQRMPVANRAASFSPFAALTGYDAHIREAARLTEQKTELDEDTKEKLNERLQFALDMADVTMWGISWTDTAHPICLSSFARVLED